MRLAYLARFSASQFASISLAYIVDIEMNMYCYCCSNRLFSDCCEPIIKNISALDPEQLMRSRFSAYAVKNYAYVLATYAPEQRRNLDLSTLRESAKNTRWLKLDVLGYSEKDAVGLVEFIATYALDADYFCIHELSSFIKQDAHWYYTTGVMQNKSGKFTPNRNDECPCGSAKKYKKCCRT
jgi:SEC-C motif-containing protein